MKIVHIVFFIWSCFLPFSAFFWTLPIYLQFPVAYKKMCWTLFGEVEIYFGLCYEHLLSWCSTRVSPNILTLTVSLRCLWSHHKAMKYPVSLAQVLLHPCITKSFRVSLLFWEFLVFGRLVGARFHQRLLWLNHWCQYVIKSFLEVVWCSLSSRHKVTV